MWIFSEDFEGCIHDAGSEPCAINLAFVTSFLLDGLSLFFRPDKTDFAFETPEQAQAAYQKIKGILQGKDNVPQIPIMGLSVGFE